MGHPLSIAVQIGLVDVLRAWGIKPTFVLGHSSGEMGAAYASGSITAEGAMAAATFRGSSNVAVTREGGMAAIGLGRDDVKEYLEEGVTIIAHGQPVPARAPRSPCFDFFLIHVSDEDNPGSSKLRSTRTPRNSTARSDNITLCPCIPLQRSVRLPPLVLHMLC